MKKLIWMMVLGGLIVLVTSCSTSNEKGNQETQAQTTSPAKTVTPKKDKVAANGQMPWVGLGEVEALVKQNPKKIVVDVYTPWCGPCKMMDRNTFSNPEIIQTMGGDFYPVKFNAEGPEPITFMGKEYTNPTYQPNKRGRNGKHQLAGFFAVRGYPSLVVLDEQMNILGKIVGYRTPEQLKVELNKYMN